MHQLGGVARGSGHTAVHVVLLDLRMPVLDGTETMKCIRHEFPGERVIILSTHDEGERIAR